MSDGAPRSEVNEEGQRYLDLYEQLRKEGFHPLNREHPDWVAGTGFRKNCEKCIEVEIARRRLK